MRAKLIVLAYLLAVSNSHSIATSKLNFSTLSSRIIGGHDAKPGEFPYQVSLQMKNPKIGYENFTHFCGGSILNDKWILTTAHCLVMFQHESADPDVALIVKAGKHDLNNIESSEQIPDIDTLFIHENFTLHSSIGFSPYDIGLIKLKNPLRLNERVAPISLPKKDAEPTGKVTLPGWGDVNGDLKDPKMPTILQTADLEIIDRVSCNEAIRKYAEQIGNPLPAGVDVINQTNICSGPMTGSKGPCFGDSGGPLISRDINGKIEVVGMVMLYPALFCKKAGIPAVHTRTSVFIDWIENILSEN